MQFTGVEHNLEIRRNKKNHKTKIKMFTAEQFKILKRECRKVFCVGIHFILGPKSNQIRYFLKGRLVASNAGRTMSNLKGLFL